MAEPANAVVWIEAMDSIVGLLVCECARDVGRCAKNLIICSIKSPMTFLTNFLFLKRDDISIFEMRSAAAVKPRQRPRLQRSVITHRYRSDFMLKGMLPNGWCPWWCHNFSLRT